MQLLFLSDLHGRMDWFDWVAKQKVDAVCMAGDLLDGFASEGLIPQILHLEEWCQRCSVPLALSSGNHDGNAEPLILDPESLAGVDEASHEKIVRFFTAAHWMNALERPGLIVDGRSEVLKTQAGSIVVTTIPYDFSQENTNDPLWQSGARLRTDTRLPWIVLHHDPPADTAVGGMMGDVSALYRIREYRPDFVLSGHLHAQPYKGAFADRVGDTWCFNPGAPIPSQSKAPVPNHILLDLGQQTATWSAAPLKGKKRLTLINSWNRKGSGKISETEGW